MIGFYYCLKSSKAKKNTIEFLLVASAEARITPPSTPPKSFANHAVGVAVNLDIVVVIVFFPFWCRRRTMAVGEKAMFHHWRCATRPLPNRGLGLALQMRQTAKVGPQAKLSKSL